MIANQNFSLFINSEGQIRSFTTTKKKVVYMSVVLPSHMTSCDLFEMVGSTDIYEPPRVYITGDMASQSVFCDCEPTTTKDRMGHHIL